MEKVYSTVVEGMTCGNCALTISKLLEKKGVKNISANAASGEVNFTAAETLNVEGIYNDIDGLGYHVVREGEEHNAESHHHDHGDNLTALLIINVILTIPLLAHMFSSWQLLHMPWVQFALATPVYAIGCYVFMPSAYRSLKHGIPNMNVLIMIGASAAYIYSIIGILFFAERAHDFLFFETAAAIITLVMVGNWLEHKTVKSTTVAIDALVKLQPQSARIVMADSMGKETILEVESKYVRNGDVVLVNNGDSIPVDGEIIKGDAQIDEHMITGESVPVHKSIGDGVVGGTMIVDGNLRVRATAVGNASVLSSIIKMVREAQAVKPALQKLADKISAVFVPAVLGIAVLTLLINMFVGLSFTDSMMRAIAVLVISCPCAMGLATPAAVAVGLGRAARNGIWVKGGDTLEQMKRIKQIVFDKTGTLTTGQLQVSNFQTILDEEQFRGIVAAMEKHSSHPIAKSIVAQWKDAAHFSLAEVREVKGKGMEATDSDGNTWKLGSERWLQPDAANAGADLYLYRNNEFAGSLNISDTLRPDAQETIAELKRMGYTLILLSGDKKAKCEELGQKLSMDVIYSEQSPAQKNEILDQLLLRAPTAMVGDGINDAPALAKATVGISLSESTQIAIQSANVILSNNQLLSLPRAMRLGIYTEQTIKQNLFWAFIYNIVAIPVAAVGLLTPVWGAGVMALSDVVLVLNSLRLGIRRIG